MSLARRSSLSLVFLACTNPAPSPSPHATTGPTTPIAALDAPVAATASFPTPPTPLAADLTRRTQEALARFPSSRVRTVAGPFVLVEVGPRTPLFDKAVTLLDRALPAILDHVAARPTLGVTVLLFSSGADYAKYANNLSDGGAGAYGAYRPSLREISADLSLGASYLTTLLHESTHVLLEDDFPAIAHWLDEGIASLYENPIFDADGGIHGEARAWRQPYLTAALGTARGRETVRLDTLFALTRGRFEGEVRSEDQKNESPKDLQRVHYAWARSVCAWLDQQGKLWPFYRAWRDGVGLDKSGEKAFAKVMGGSATEWNDRWVSWAK